MKRKREAFLSGQKSCGKKIQKEINQQVAKAKVLYKRKLERNFNENNPRAAWQQMQTMTGYKDTNRRVMDCNQDFVDSLSEFYARFHVPLRLVQSSKSEENARSRDPTRLLSDLPA